MRVRKNKNLTWLILLAFVTSLGSSCAVPQPPKPRVLLPAASYPNYQSIAGVTVAVIPFDPNRDLYAAPNDPNPRRPDFNWFTAGVCPTRLIFNNDGDVTFVVNPRQITCTDVRGVTYQPYGPREAGDAVVASEAFGAHVRGALAGALLGAALGAGLGAALGAIAGGGRWAGTGAAIGATAGGIEGLFLGSVASRAQMEANVRRVVFQKMLRTAKVGKGMFHEGLVYFPAVTITSVRVLLADAYSEDVLEMNIPVVMPLQTPQPEVRKEDTQTGGEQPNP